MNWGRIMLAIGSLQFIIAMLVAEQLYPGYNPLHNYISDLGALKAPTATLFNTSVALLGIFGIIAAILLRKEIGIVGSALLALASAGAIGVGAFPEDYGTPHGISALITFLFGALAVMVIGLRRGGAFKPFGLAMGAIALIALALFIPRVQTPLGIGGIERLIAYPTLIFLLVYGLSGQKTG
ncbi:MULTISPECIES: DUF998 domain-containing protein [Pyrobaculum]|uniref:DUF998 domain-containing protein n=2 Tax=Pyrobaculum arsenaticum TaxID=121277 RepID=A0A7L4P5Y9_9CREN|nr:DUF998 domain-containing protein [Pyrobaculum arsenaticum]MCY0890540.1 DUF998 domain-containing protein [Pyrobaculum arsenaticum]NYR14518.1 DUF998 domain-containing protein [Pyrobaculum arsenaticum]